MELQGGPKGAPEASPAKWPGLRMSLQTYSRFPNSNWPTFGRDISNRRRKGNKKKEEEKHKLCNMYYIKDVVHNKEKNINKNAFYLDLV